MPISEESKDTALESGRLSQHPGLLYDALLDAAAEHAGTELGALLLSAANLARYHEPA